MFRFACVSLFSCLVVMTAAAATAEPVIDSVSEADGKLAARVDALSDEVGRLREEVQRLRSSGPAFFSIKPNIYLRVRPELDSNIASLGRLLQEPGPGIAARFEDQHVFYVASRLQLGLTAEPIKDFKLVLTVQDARLWGEERTFRSGTNGSIDLFEGYMEFSDILGSGVNLRAGRFTMDYGSTMHVNAGSSGQTGQVYDGLRVQWHRPKLLKIDMFTTMVKTGLGPVFSTDTREDWESFSGFFLTTDSPIKYFDVELFGFYLDDAFANFSQKLGTVGGRLILKPVEGLKIWGEAAAQFGRVTGWSQDAVLMEKDHLAAVYLGGACYQFVGAPTTPSIGMFFMYATGDDTPWDGQSSAFKPTFGSTHNFLGYTNIFRATGIWEIGPKFRLWPISGLEVAAEYHFLQQTADGGLYQHFGTYAGNGTRNGMWTNDRGLLIPAGNSGFVGHELDLYAIWTPHPWLEVAAAYSAFFPGGALDGASIQGVVEKSAGVHEWQRETLIGDRSAHRMVVWATFSY